MNPDTTWSESPEWFDDARSERRWRDALTLLARVESLECMGKTHDLSSGGLGACLHGVEPTPGEEIAMDVLFAGQVLEFRGEVVHTAPCPEGCRVGVRLRQTPAALGGMLEIRYGSSGSGRGRVT